MIAKERIVLEMISLDSRLSSSHAVLVKCQRLGRFSLWLREVPAQSDDNRVPTILESSG